LGSIGKFKAHEIDVSTHLNGRIKVRLRYTHTIAPNSHQLKRGVAANLSNFSFIAAFEPIAPTGQEARLMLNG